MEILIGSIGTFTLVSFEATTKDGTARIPATCTTDPSPPPPPPPPTDQGDPECNACGDASSRSKSGSLSELTFRWTSFVTGAPVTLTVDDNNNGNSASVSPTGVDAVADGAEVLVASAGSKFSVNTIFNVNGISSTLHTSCSVAINLGLVIQFDGIGTLTIIGFQSKTKQGVSRTESSCGKVPPRCRQPDEPAVDRECNACLTEAGEVPCPVLVFRQKFTFEDAVGSHACSLEALACV
jgi:hypothetical protein